MLLSLLRLLHVVNALLMAWPFYALVIVNQRALLGPPLGDRADLYLERIVKNRTLPCYVFQGTALVSGLALIFARGRGLGALFQEPLLGLKVLFLLTISATLTYVHTRLQPTIDALVGDGRAPLAEAEAFHLRALRHRRKRAASSCLFLVLTNVILGVQAWSPFPLWLTALLLAAAALFVWRAATSAIPYGWF